jgi:hypothetical protein
MAWQWRILVSGQLVVRHRLLAAALRVGMPATGTCVVVAKVPTNDFRTRSAPSNARASDCLTHHNLQIHVPKTSKRDTFPCVKLLRAPAGSRRKSLRRGNDGAYHETSDEAPTVRPCCIVARHRAAEEVAGGPFLALRSIEKSGFVASVEKTSRSKLLIDEL